MGRIYLRLPQCNNLQDLTGPKQLAVLACGALILVILIFLLIHSFFLDDPEEKGKHHHFLPTVPDINSQHSYFSYGPNVRYGIVIDCGSSGSRVYVYIWPPHSGNPKDLLSVQQLKDQYNQAVVKKVSPGLDTFEDHPEKASDYLYPLLKFAAEHIPAKQHKETLLYILATAGMRLLSEESQKAILQDLQRDIPKSFDFIIAENNFEVISGKQEGVYAWIAANYALQKFGHGEEDRYEHPLVAVDVPGENGEIKQHVRRRTVGMLDMGGGSMQIAFEITNNVESIPKHLVAEFNLGCQSVDIEHTYRVYVTTFLGYGANEARSRYEELLIKNHKLSQPTSVSKDQMGKRGMSDTKKPAVDVAPDLSNTYKDGQFSKNSGQQVLDNTLKQDISSQNQLNQSIIGNDGIQSSEKSHDLNVVKNINGQNKREMIAKQLFNNSLSRIKREAAMSDAVDPVEQGQIPAPLSLATVVIRDPCLQNGLMIQAREPEYENVYNFSGTGNYRECKKSLEPLLNLTVACNEPPCSMNGVHQPPITYHNSQFYGFSEFWYTMEDVFRIGGLYEHEIFETHAKDFCDKRWSHLMELYKKNLYPKAEPERFRMECFKSAWMTTVLHKGLKFPETYRGLHSVQFINYRDVQWTLGALLHRTRYLPLREIQEFEEGSKYKPPWLASTHILYNEYLLVLCFIVVLAAILIYMRRLKLCSPKVARDMSRVPSMSYFMTDMDQVEQGVRLKMDYTYPDR